MPKPGTTLSSAATQPLEAARISCLLGVMAMAAGGPNLADPLGLPRLEGESPRAWALCWSGDPGARAKRPVAAAPGQGHENGWARRHR